MTLQDLVNLKREDNAKYKILFGDLVADIYNCKDDVKYSSFLEKEPDWGGLEKKDISLIVSDFVHLHLRKKTTPTWAGSFVLSAGTRFTGGFTATGTAYAGIAAGKSGIAETSVKV